MSGKYEKDLLESYPEGTIKLVRELYTKYSVDYPQYAEDILIALGHYFGYRIKKQFLFSPVVSIKDIN